MRERKIVLVIVEGPSDATALGGGRSAKYLLRVMSVLK